MTDINRVMFDFDRVASTTGARMAAAKRQVINEAARAVVRATPVRTGRLRASWFFSATFPASGGTVPGYDAAKRASAAILARTTGGINAVELDRDIYFLNSAGYAIYVEARTQFVRKALARAKAIENSAIETIRRVRGR